MGLDELQKQYERLADYPESNLSGFVLFRGEQDAQHFVLGEDHSPIASLAIMRALYKLVVREKTLVLGEAIQGAQHTTITNLQQAWARRSDLSIWQQESIEFLIENEVPLQTYDDSKSARIVSQSKGKGKTDKFMLANAKRDYALANQFILQTQSYEHVIGVFGSLHVMSSVMEKCLGSTPYAAYVFKPSSAG